MSGAGALATAGNTSDEMDGTMISLAGAITIGVTNASDQLNTGKECHSMGTMALTITGYSMRLHLAVWLAAAHLSQA